MWEPEIRTYIIRYTITSTISSIYENLINYLNIQHLWVVEMIGANLCGITGWESAWDLQHVVVFIGVRRHVPHQFVDELLLLRHLCRELQITVWCQYFIKLTHVS